MHQPDRFYQDGEKTVQPWAGFPSLNDPWVRMKTQTPLPQRREHARETRYGTFDQSIGSVKQDVGALFERVEMLGINGWEKVTDEISLNTFTTTSNSTVIDRLVPSLEIMIG
jgi:hypothetical protein